MAPILTANGVRKTYRTGTHEVEALCGVDLDITEGELVMVMGPSGNGKTTLLNCLSGLDDIDDGTVHIDGLDIHGMPDAQRTEHRAKRMGFIFQSFNLIPVFTAVENVELPLLVTSVPPKQAREQARAILERVGLADRADHRPTELSGGEQQRVAIARALVSEPAIVWADEPTGNLDSHTAGEVLELLSEVHQHGQTLVVVTHDRGIGASGQRLVQVRDGQVTYDGDPATLLNERDFLIGVAVPLAIVLLLPVLVDLARRPTFRNLAVRNIARRKGEAALVVVGAMLGTSIITASFILGDTITQSIRDSARTSLGPVDVVLRTSDDALLATLEGAADGLDGVDATATIRSLPAVVATVGDRPLAEPAAVLVEADLDAMRGLGVDGTATGFETAGSTPAPGDVLLNRSLAIDLGVGEGDAVELFAAGSSIVVTVRTVVPEVGVAGYAPSNGIVFGGGSAVPAFVAPGTIDELRSMAVATTAAVPPTDEVLVSLSGGVFDVEDALEPAATELADVLGDADVEVRQVKRDLLDAAQETGDSIGELYFGIGGFSVIAGILLLVNLFVMLSEERKTELGMLRAVGLKRNHLMRSFAMEGAIYAVVAAIIGGVLGIGVGAAITAVASSILSDAGADFSYSLYVEPATLVTGIGLGLAISMLTVWATSARISRLNVIRAIRDLPEPVAHQARLRTIVLSSVGVAAGVFMLQAGLSAEEGVPTLAGPPIAFFSAIPLLRRIVSQRIAVTVLAGAALVYSVTVFSIFPDEMGEVGIETFVVQGVLLVAAAVTILSSADAFWKGTARLLAATGAGLSPRLALAYPLARKFRTGMLLGMYSLVIFTMTFLSVFSALLEDQGPTITDEVSGGYDIFLDTSSGNPVTPAQLLDQPDVTAVASLESQFAQFTAPWQDDPSPWAITGVDEGILALDSAPHLSSYDDAYATADEAYRAVLGDPALALVPDFFLAGGGGPPPGEIAVGDTVDVVTPDGGRTTLSVAGVVANDWVFNGVFVGAEAMDAIFGDQAVANRFYVASVDGSDIDQVASRLSGAFIPNGVDARSFAAEVDEQLAAQQGFFSLMRGYLGLGLLIGIAGLGVVMVRAVRERRREIGMLRAMGFSSAVVRRTFLLEAAFVALQGSLLGIGLGLVTSWQVLSAGDVFGDDVTLVVPWTALSLIFAIPFVASLLATLAPAAQASRIRPAVALRIAD